MTAIMLALNTVDTIQHSTLWKACLRDQGEYVSMGHYSYQGKDISNDSQITTMDKKTC